MRKLTAYLNRVLNPGNEQAGCPHDWGKAKQWVVDNKVIIAQKCRKCGKIKGG